MSPTKVSAIVVNWNTRDELETCLTALTTHAPGIEIIVIDNASKDGSARMTRTAFPKARLIQNTENAGFARANNQGIAAASGSLLLLLNSDTKICPGAIEALREFMAARPGAGACGPRLVNRDGSLQPSAYPIPTPEREMWRLMFLDRVWPRATYPASKWETDEPQRVDVIKGAALMLRRAALDQVGLLDESYFMYTEEVDLCYRLALAGWEAWWVPQAQVIHAGSASTRQAREEMYVQLYRSKAQFFRNIGGEAWAALFRKFLWAAYLPRWAASATAAMIWPQLKSQRWLYARMLREIGRM